MRELINEAAKQLNERQEFKSDSGEFNIELYQNLPMFKNMVSRLKKEKSLNDAINELKDSTEKQNDPTLLFKIWNGEKGATLYRRNMEAIKVYSI